MYVIESLTGNYENCPGCVSSEFRLLVSGVIYNGKVKALEWYKSTAARSLLTQPFSLAVVSQPADEFPQELVLRFTAPESVTESGANFMSTFSPDEEIAQDIAVLLTVLLRRLVTVYVHVGRVAKHIPVSGAYDANTRLPIVSPSTKMAWASKPMGFVVGGNRAHAVIERNPKQL